jgi:hypothetical protein
MENAFGVLFELQPAKFGPATLPCLQKYFGSKVAENPREGFLFAGKKVDRRGAPWRVLTMF